MATTYGNISHLVFRRNISLTVENYVLDYQMLKVLDQINGIRDVSAVAARLNINIADVRDALVRLFRQRIIVPAGSHAAAAQIIESRQSSPARIASPDPPKPVADPNLDRPSQINADEQTSPAVLSETPPSAPGAAPLPPQRSPKAPSPPAKISRKLEAASQTVENASEPPKKNTWHWPDHKATVFDSGNGNGNGLKHRSTALKNTGVFETVSQEIARSQGTASDIYSIANVIEHNGTLGRSNAFAPTFRSEPEASGIGLSQNDRAPLDRAISFEKLLSQEQIEAISLFEEGLALLQRGAFEQALVPFEKSMALDPQNRSCRANIQRIRKKLDRDD